MRVADYVIQRLCDAGVSHVFQVTGRGSLFLNDAVAKRKDIQAISMHHEQSCAYAAVGFAERTGGLGACLVSTGCASTNALTGVLNAWQDGVPCVFISGQNTLKETSRFTGIPLRTFGQQEADIISIVSPITKFSHMLTNATDIFQVMDSALLAAMTGRKGPIWIDIPLDLQSAMIAPEVLSSHERIGPTDDTRNFFESNDIDYIVDALNSASRPVILLGRGVRAAGAVPDLKQFVETNNIPVTFAASAPDTYGTSNELSIGSVGAMGCSRAGNFAVANSDLLLVIGNRLTSLTTGTDFCKFARHAKKIVVDIDPVEHSKRTIQIDRLVKLDAKVFLEVMNERKLTSKNSVWVDKCKHWKSVFGPIEKEFVSTGKVDLYQLGRVLSGSTNRPFTLVTDSGFIEVILPSNIAFNEKTFCVHPSSQGAMGFALPAAVGVQFATDDLVVAVIGDGSIMMNLQELETIAYHRLPIKIVVVNNNVYSIIRRRQVDLFRKRTIGTDPANGVSCPEFKKVAECFGLKYQKIESSCSLDQGIERLFNTEGAVLCEIMGRHDQSYVEVGQARSLEDGRFVRRPLEDQQPFLERELFLSEMLVKPIDQ
jgi:acetolactate synthase-1/2/3 large subunit